MAKQPLSPVVWAARIWQSRTLPERLHSPCVPFLYGLLAFNARPFQRGAKTTTKIKRADLAQGPLEALPSIEEPDNLAPSYPPVIQQHLNHVKKFSDCVVLTRVGNFYELYADQAEQFGPLLNLKVAQRRTSLGPVAMSGFQVFQLDRYLKLLVQDLNKQVAISEEIRNSAADQVKAGGLLYNRKVTRVITAGTLIDENFMDPYESNYLLSIHVDNTLPENVLKKRDPSRDVAGPRDEAQVGLSWVDLSSGDFFLQQTNLSSLNSVLARIAPREIVLDTALETFDQARLARVLGDGSHIITYHSPSSAAGAGLVWDEMVDKPTDGKAINFTKQEFDAASVLLDYVRGKLMDMKITLRYPTRRLEDDYMSIDKQSLRGLEIRTTLREGLLQGGLLHAIRKTVTKSGARLLNQRIVSPSMSLSIINARLDLVSEMCDHDGLHEDTVALLRRTFDTLRLLQKFSIGRGDADDLLGLAKTIYIMDELASMLRTHVVSRQERSLDGEQPVDMAFLSKILDSLDLETPKRLASRIQDSIDEDSLSRKHDVENAQAAEIAGFANQVLGEDGDGAVPERQASSPSRKPKRPSTTRDAEDDHGEIWIMRSNASATLRKAHHDLNTLLAERLSLGRDLREKLQSTSLALKWTAQLGHFCHVKGKDTRVDIPGARTINTTKSTRTFYLAEWTSLGFRIEEAKLRIRAEEQRVFSALRNNVIGNLVTLRRNAAVLDELDVACSSATLAKERNLIRPILHAGTTHKIIGGRHPMVDVGLQARGRLFTSNDCVVGAEQRILLITGPNMAGKSTYLRQNALLSILAQTGCFVPADYAEIGLVDKIFSRVGSADNLYHDQSTFMVEMLEVAEILNHATPRSFVIMDEVGRGTTPEDGIAVGYACLHHLHTNNQCRALFATHFHTLADMTRGFDRVACYCTDVAEGADGSWVYVHKLRRGVNRDSHALKVARLAGLPEDAIAVAAGVLKDLRRQDEAQRTKGQLDIQEPARLQAQAG